MPIATESKHIPCCLVSKRIGYIRFTPHHTRLGRVCTQRQRHPWQTVESTQSVMRVTNRKSGGTSCLEKNHSGKAGKLQTLQQLSGSNYPGFRDPQPATRPERTSAPHMFSDSNSNKSSAYQPRHHHAILRVT